jgi:hypothetical protein
MRLMHQLRNRPVDGGGRYVGMLELAPAFFVNGRIEPCAGLVIIFSKILQGFNGDFFCDIRHVSALCGNPDALGNLKQFFCIRDFIVLRMAFRRM